MLIAVDLAADILFGYHDIALWPYVLPVLTGMIVLLACENNGLLKKLNLFMLILILVGAFSAHL